VRDHIRHSTPALVTDENIMKIAPKIHADLTAGRLVNDTGGPIKFNKKFIADRESLNSVNALIIYLQKKYPNVTEDD
jgi:hypothetical protein